MITDAEEKGLITPGKVSCKSIGLFSLEVKVAGALLFVIEGANLKRNES